MWKLVTFSLLLAPTLAHADECRFQAPRDAALDLTGVHTLVVNLGQHNLHLNGTPASTGQVHGRACASAKDRLDDLRLTQHREGDRLILTAENTSSNWNINLFGASHYAYMELQVDVPATLAVELNVGSGDAQVANVAQLDARVGSGDLQAKGVRGHFDAHVGSGDIKADDVGETHVASIGSGDFTVNRVRGDISIGSIGSGDADLRAIGGNVDVKSVGSGSLHVDGVAHDLHVARVGSGEVEHKSVAGRVDVPKDD
jgi:DUF4097 and DUF4098 domain-containing protein YvlB